MTRERAIRLANKWASGGVCTLKDGEAQEYHKMALAALREQSVPDTDVVKTNADHIRSMTDEELANLLCTADWCETCDQMREEGTCKAMELDGPLNKHCVSAALRWLQQPYKEET